MVSIRTPCGVNAFVQKNASPPTFSWVRTWRRTLFYGILYLLRVAHFSGRNTRGRFYCLMDRPRKPCFSSLLDRRRISFPSLRVLPEDVRPMTIEFSQEACGVNYAPHIRSIREATRNTPPQVDTSTYTNKKSKHDYASRRECLFLPTPEWTFLRRSYPGERGCDFCCLVSVLQT
jgi:hypothetical protein